MSENAKISRINNIGSKKNKAAALNRLFKMMQIEQQYPGFLEVTSRRLINEKIVNVIKSRMKTSGYDDKIIDLTRINDIEITGYGFLDFSIINDYKSDDGFDVSKAREEGTVRHFIKNTVAKALRFIAGGFIVAYSKGHWVGGIPATHIIKTTIKENTPLVQEQLNEETNMMFEKILKS